MNIPAPTLHDAARKVASILDAMRQRINDPAVERAAELSTFVAQSLTMSEATPPEWVALIGAHKITAREAVVLGTLWRERHKPFASKSAIHHALYGLDPNGGACIKIVDVFVCKIRKKLQATPWRIETVWAQGYKLVKGKA